MLELESPAGESILKVQNARLVPPNVFCIAASFMIKTIADSSKTAKFINIFMHESFQLYSI